MLWMIFLSTLRVRVMFPIDMGVRNFSANLLFVSQLTETCNIVEFFPYHFLAKDLKKHQSIFTGGFLDLKDIFFNFYETT